MADAIINAAAETVQDGLDGPLGDRDGDTTSPPVASTISLPHNPKCPRAAPKRRRRRAASQSPGPVRADGEELASRKNSSSGMGFCRPARTPPDLAKLLRLT